MTNAYILHTNYGTRGNKLDHEEFIPTIARTLIQEGLRTSTLNTPHVRTENLVQNDLMGDHFLSRPCYACNGSWSDIRNKILPKHCSRLVRVLCTTPCFKVLHTNQNYLWRWKDKSIHYVQWRNKYIKIYLRDIVVMYICKKI